MFGKKPGRLGEIDVSQLTYLDGSLEFARMWKEPDGPQSYIIDPKALGADPFLFGMALADAVQHGANAYAQAVNITKQEALERIWQGLDAERNSPTDSPTEVGPDGSSIQ
jgi:hypothetical protein